MHNISMIWNHQILVKIHLFIEKMNGNRIICLNVSKYMYLFARNHNSKKIYQYIKMVMQSMLMFNMTPVIWYLPTPLFIYFCSGKYIFTNSIKTIMHLYKQIQWEASNQNKRNFWYNVVHIHRSLICIRHYN